MPSFNRQSTRIKVVVGYGDRGRRHGPEIGTGEERLSAWQGRMISREVVLSGRLGLKIQTGGPLCTGDGSGN